MSDIAVWVLLAVVLVMIIVLVGFLLVGSRSEARAVLVEEPIDEDADPEPARSVFGSHGVAGGPGIPPLPPAPADGGYPSVMPFGEPADEGGRPPAFRSTMPSDWAQSAVSSTADPPNAEAELERTAGARHQTPSRDDEQEWGPRRRTLPRLAHPGPDDPYDDGSMEVSAGPSAPRLGPPQSARGAVSAQHRGVETAEEIFEETLIAARRRAPWSLVPVVGAPIPVTADVVVLGRRPSFDAEFPEAQLLSVPDETRTVSKTHARLRLVDGDWLIADLGSTNGVILVGRDGSERELVHGEEAEITGTFLLGDAEISIRPEHV